MDVQVVAEQDFAIVEPTGYIDEHTAHDFRRGLDKAIALYPVTIVVDFGKVDFMDSTGIGTMLARYKVMRDRNIAFCVRNVNPQVDKLFRLTGIYSILNLIR